MSAEPSYEGTIRAGTMLVVRGEISGAHFSLQDYVLFPGDMLMKQEDGTFYKFGPGLGISGFTLTPEQELALEPNEETRYGIGGMDYFLGA